MPVYGRRLMDKLDQGLDSLASQFVGRMRLILQPDEFVAAFITPEHIATLRATEEIVGSASMLSSGQFAFPVCIGENTSVGNSADTSHNPRRYRDLVVGAAYQRAPIIVPRYVNEGLQHSCPEDVHAKITEWAIRRHNIGRAFGDARDALYHLNEICPNAETMTTLLPCLPTVMGSITDGEEAPTNKRAAALAARKQVGTLPRILRPIKERMLEVSAIVNSVSLMQDAEWPMAKNKEVVIHRAASRCDAPNMDRHLFYNEINAYTPASFY